jgi:cytosine/adenosine deaminase-related metal-dependent hydrolase
VDDTSVLVVKECARSVAGGACEGRRRIDGRGCLAASGLVGCHHLDQWTTRVLADKIEEIAQ